MTDKHSAGCGSREISGRLDRPIQFNVTSYADKVLLEVIRNWDDLGWPAIEAKLRAVGYDPQVLLAEGRAACKRFCGSPGERAGLTDSDGLRVFFALFHGAWDAWYETEGKALEQRELGTQTEDTND